jgi:predicted ABC-type ATPase
MIKWILNLFFGKPTHEEILAAKQVRELFENAERDGYEIDVKYGCISKKKKVILEDKI